MYVCYEWKNKKITRQRITEYFHIREYNLTRAFNTRSVAKSF